MNALTGLCGLCLSSMLIAFAGATNYINDWDRLASFTCSSGQFLGHIESVHSDHYEDRRWSFTCRKAEYSTTGCVWSPEVNDWDDMLAFMCPDGKVITGMSSKHEDHYEDRRFGFQCCAVTGKELQNCYITNYANTWDGRLLMDVPSGKALTGAFSYHDNGKEDRIWKFMVCDLVPKQICPVCYAYKEEH